MHVRRWLCSVAMLVAVVVAGCGGGKKSATAATTPAGSAAVAKQVPPSVRAKGTLTVAADATYAPNEFVGPDGHTVVGMDVDLANALGRQLGMKVKVQNATFDSIIPGLAAGKYDIGISSFTDTKAREQTVDFVTYFKAGTSFYARSAGAPNVNGLPDLCGHAVSVEKGTTQQTAAAAQDGTCRKAGKPGVSVLVFPDQNGANLAISSGRAQVGMADSPVAAYQVKRSGGQFKLIGQTFGTAPYGIAIPKPSHLSAAILAGVKALIADGTYASILARWGQQAGTISSPQVNGATS
jgi:polar amino acid transport system substrate-binding protein